MHLVYCQWRVFASRFISMQYWLTAISFWFVVSQLQSSNLLPLCSARLCFVLSPGSALGCLPWTRTKTFLPSYCFCFVFIYQLRGLLSFFLFLLTLCSLDGFLCFSLSCTCWKSSIPGTSCFEVALTTELPVTPATYINPIGWHHATDAYHRPSSSLYKPVLDFPAFFLDSWQFKMRAMVCPKTLVRNYHYLLRKNPEEHSFQAKIYSIIKKCLAIYDHDISLFIPCFTSTSH